MKKRKLIVSVLAGLMAFVMVLSLFLGLLPTKAYASSSEIRKQINQLKKEKEELKGQMDEVKEQYKENEDEIQDILARKSVIEQEVQLLSEEITNINAQISAYNILIADKQDELDNAEGRYEALNEANRVRVRTMEEEGELSYWEVLFKANSFSDLLDRMDMIDEIAAADKRRIQELTEAKEQVGEAQNALNIEKAEMEVTKADLDRAEADLAAKREEAVAVFQELLEKADDLDALFEEYEQKEQEYLKEIAAKEVEFTAAKQAEWEAYMATYVPPTTGGVGGSDGSNNGQGGGTTGNGDGQSSLPSGGGSWLIPCSYSSITSPFGPRNTGIAGASTNHLGVDLDSTTGTLVYATRAGVVIKSSYSGAAGNHIKIDHRDGFVSEYMHLDQRYVTVGQIVGAGDKIGTVGATGIVSGDHLHFGLIKNGVYVNPASYVPLH
ncbi:MAG: peptidoglycan DD-metalloendopeptidase family protein [Eubacteriales bacterium]|nr:peptidoglycan DD-metalloendopeptidase family protein [Eubacteriales bacterium]